MCLEAKIKLYKNHNSQQIGIPAIVVRDSQYSFEDGDDLYLQIEPSNELIIICKNNKRVSVDLVPGTNQVLITREA